MQFYHESIEVMAILHSCCFWKSVRKGSYASAIYGLVYFGSSCVIISVYLHEEHKYLSGEVEKPSGESFLEKEAISPTTVIFNILLLVCASCGIISCVLLIIGLRTDRREFLMPWIICMLLDLLIECSHFTYLIVIETLDFEPLTATLFTVDLFIMCLNVYSLLCVISQYQEYKAGRGHASIETRSENRRYIPPALATATCLNTFRQSRSTPGGVVGSPLKNQRTNFSIVREEETSVNGKLGMGGGCAGICIGGANIGNLDGGSAIARQQQHLSMLQSNRRVQFSDDDDDTFPMYCTDSTTRILGEINGNGRMLTDYSISDEIADNNGIQWQSQQHFNHQCSNVCNNLHHHYLQDID